MATKESKALSVVIRALRQENGLYDIEACVDLKDD